MNFKPEENSNDQEQIPDPFQQFAFESYQALLKDRTILLNSDIDKSVIERVVLPLTTLSQKSNKPIKLLINSSGGSIEDGQAVVDAILTSRAPIITIALGKAMSAAFDILLAGDYRIAYPNSVLMCHSGSTSMPPQTLAQINQEAELHKMYFKRWSKWYASRTNIAEKQWYKLLNGGLNKYWFPEEALKDGLIQETIILPKKSARDIAKYKI